MTEYVLVKNDAGYGLYINNELDATWLYTRLADTISYIELQIKQKAGDGDVELIERDMKGVTFPDKLTKPKPKAKAKAAEEE